MSADDVPRALGPFVPPCFELGAQWYSYDNGFTWVRIPPPRLMASDVDSMTVISVDPKRGEIVVKVTRPNET